jgi:hypothetical protein
MLPFGWAQGKPQVATTHRLIWWTKIKSRPTLGCCTILIKRKKTGVKCWLENVPAGVNTAGRSKTWTLTL